MKFLIVGVGAIGGVTAACMSKAGHDVTVVCRNDEIAYSLRSGGMHISGIYGEQKIPLNAVGSVEQLQDTYDCCIVATKSYDTVPAIQSILPFVAKEGLVLVLQNGICIDELLKVVDVQRAACGVTSWSCTMLSPIHMEITGSGQFVIGMTDGRSCPLLERIGDALSSVAPTEISESILEHMYAKLIINSGITCGGALTGVLLGKLLKNAYARKFFIAIVYEDMAVAKALDIKVPPFGGKLDYYKFVSGRHFWDHWRRHIMLLIIGIKYRNLKSSSLTALQRGKKTEIDALNGWICERGKSCAVPTPVNQKLTDMIKEIEAGTRTITINNLKELF